MSVLITGIGGFVGSHLAKRLVEQGQQVVGIVRDWKTNSLDALGLTNKVTVARADVRDTEALERIISQYEVDTVFHLAAVSTVAEAQRNPVDVFDVNVMGTVRLLDVCRRRGVSKILVTSSDKCYGNSPVPYHESMPLLGLEPYPASKVCEDIVARSFAHTYNLPVIVMRACNIYGPGDLNDSRLIPSTILRLLRGQPARLYESARYMIRQFVYVDDVVEAYLTAMETLPQWSGSAWNVGGFEQTGVSIESIIQKLVARIGGTIKSVPSTIREIPRQFLDDSSLRELGWKPQVSLDEGLDRTVEWYRTWVEDSVYAG